MTKFIGYVKSNSEKKIEEQKKILKLYVSETADDNEESNAAFDVMLDTLNKGDTVVVTSLKTISYDAKRIIEFVSLLEEHGLYFLSIEEEINTMMQKDKGFGKTCVLLSPYVISSKIPQKKKAD